MTQQAKGGSDKVEDLLKPRWKCIARYPDSPVGIGQILSGKTFNVTGGTKFHFEDYPAIFKPLAWYEEREADEMPEYVKEIRSGKIEKVLSWSNNGFVYEKESTNPIVLPNVTVSMAVIHCYQPATEADYITYLNSQTK